MLPEQPNSPPSTEPVPPGVPDTPDAQPKLQFGDAHKKALITLLDRYEAEDISTRLQEIRNIRKAREFWRGDQYLWWSEVEQRWKTLASTMGLESQKDLDDVYQYVTNIYQAYGLTFMSVVSQNAPTVRFWPQSPKDPDDQSTADGASAAYELVARNNDFDAKLIDEAFYLWCDGAFGGYVRYVTDAERFGTTKTPIMGKEEYQATPDEVRCVCGYGMTLPEGALAQGLQPQPCPNCQQMLTMDNVKYGERAERPVVKDYKTTPNGQEVQEIVGKLEMRIPSYCRRLEDAPYLIYATEIPKGKVKATYPELGDDISIGELGPTDTEERRTRLNLTSDIRSGNAANQADTLLTFKRVWFRPWAFALLEKKLADELNQLFPEGVFFAAVGKTVCEARAEAVDDHWKICFAFPGDGSTRPSVGGALISVQERYNTLSNIEVETHEHGIPTLFVDEEAINLPAWKDEGNTPGLTFPVRTRPGLPVQAQMFQTEPAPVSPQLVAHREELMGPVAQFLTGLFPALFGGGAIGNDTAAGYAMQRDQAMGRIGLLWRSMKRFHAEFAKITVECFRANRSGEVTMASMNQLGQFDWKALDLSRLQGAFFCYPETNEDFPMSWTQKRNSFDSLIQSPMVNLLSTPANMDAYQRVMGPLGLQFPGADARAQQFAEISELLAATPLEMPAAPGPDGMPMAPQQVPTVDVDAELDDHTTHMQTIQEWAASPAGRKAREENPQGYLNVKLHFMKHQQIVAQQQMQQQMAKATAEGGQTTSESGQEAPAAPAQ